MAKLFLLFISVFFFALQVKSQITDNYEVLRAMEFYRQQKMIDGGNNALLESDIEGSPYLNKEFENGSVYTYNKQKYADIPLRYNIYNEAIEFKSSDNKVYTLSTPELIEKIEFGGNTYFYLPYSNLKKIKKGFLILLEPGNTALYLKPEIFFKEAVKPAAYQDAQPASFLKKPDTYYIKFGTEQAKLIGNKKDLIELFPNSKEKVEEYIKKNKLKVSEPDDLKMLVRYYNSL